MEFIYGLTFLLVLAAANPGPQFSGSGGIPKTTPIGNAEVPNQADPLEWTKSIQYLVDLTREVLTAMGQIALNDNPVVGARIVETLNGEIERADKILADYSTKVATTGSLNMSSADAKKAHNDVGGVLLGSYRKTYKEMKQLSPEAQDKYYQEYNAGVKRCNADPCVVPNLGEVPNQTDSPEWTKSIQYLVDLTREVLTAMGKIALNDNPVVGARIVETLNGEIERADKILADYSAKVATTGRVERSSANAKKAHNDVGGVLVGSYGKTYGDLKQLSPETQNKYYQEYKAGVKKCNADPCVDAAKSLQDADEGKRQG